MLLSSLKLICVHGGSCSALHVADDLIMGLIDFLAMAWEDALESLGKDFLVVRWLSLSFPPQGPRVWSLVGELRKDPICM